MNEQCRPLRRCERRTRRVAGCIERRRRHEKGVVVSTSERDLHGRVSRSRQGVCRARGRYCTSQATCRGEHAGAACEPAPSSRPSVPPAALTRCAARLAGMAPCPLQRDGRAPHRARSTSCFVPIRRPGSRPAFAGADASVCHGTSRSLPHVRRRDRDGVYFGQPTTRSNHTRPIATRPAQPVPLASTPASTQ